MIVEEDLPDEYINILGHTNSDRINRLVHDIIYNTINNLESGNIKVNLSEEIGYALTGLRSFMFKEVYKGNILRKEREKAKFVFEQVFMYYVKNPDKLPKFYSCLLYTSDPNVVPVITSKFLIASFISFLTDSDINLPSS